MEKGYYICVDQSFTGDEKAAAQTVYTLCEKGYEDRLLFSHDLPFFNDFEIPQKTNIEKMKDNHINRLSFLFDELFPQLKKYGFKDKNFENFTKYNAQKILNY